MKKILSIVLALVLFAVPAFAASSMTPNLKYYQSKTTDQRVISVVCTAHTDGTFTDYNLADTNWTPYFEEGYYIGHMWAVNSATDDHTSGAVTITDATTQQLIGSTAGDTLTLSTAASGVAYLSASRGATQRPVTSQLTIAVSDTGSTAVVFTLYILLVR